MEALIVVDMQNDFLEGGALAVPDSNRIIPVINKLIKKHRFIVYTQDWHPAGHKSFASSHAGKNVGDIISLGGVPQFLWPDHCVQGDFGSEFHADLPRDENITVIKKGMNPEIDSYSAFYDNRKLTSTGLYDHLIKNNIKRLYFCGLAADYCVKFSVLDALEHGFETILITDATKGVNVQPGDYERALEEMNMAGAKLITSNEIL